MARIAGPRGQFSLSPNDVASMDAKSVADFVLSVDQAAKSDPGRRIEVTDTPSGGLLVKWGPIR